MTPPKFIITNSNNPINKKKKNDDKVMLSVK